MSKTGLDLETQRDRDMTGGERVREEGERKKEKGKATKER